MLDDSRGDRDRELITLKEIECISVKKQNGLKGPLQVL